MTKTLVGTAIAAATIAVAGLVALTTRADERATSDQSQAAAVGMTTTTSLVAGAVTSTSAPAPAAATSQTAWQRPVPGRYRFHTSRTGSSPHEHDGTLDIAHRRANAYTEARDHGAFKLRRSFTQTDKGLTETGFVIDSNGEPVTCTWATPILVIPSKPTDGRAFTHNTTCTTDVGGTKAVIEYNSTSTVVGMRSAQTAQGTAPLLRIDREVSTRTTTGTRVAARRSQFVQYYDAVRGLLAQSTEEATETGPSGASTFRIVETMLTLQPEDPDA